MNENKIKQIIRYKDISIRLIKPIEQESMPYNAISNIEVVDAKEEIIWKAEDPRSHYDQYYDMHLDTTRDVLVATTGINYRCEISLIDGKIIDYRLIK